MSEKIDTDDNIKIEQDNEKIFVISKSEPSENDLIKENKSSDQNDTNDKDILIPIDTNDQEQKPHSKITKSKHKNKTLLKNISQEIDDINPKNESQSKSSNLKNKTKNIKNKKEISPQESSFLRFNKLSYYLLSISTGLSKFSSLSLSYFFKDKLKLSPSQLSIINSITLIPMIIKPLFGLLSDLFPLFGYKRKYYVIISGIMQSIIWLIMIFIDSSVISSVICMILNTACVSCQSVMGQAIAVQINNFERRNKESKESRGSNVNKMFIFQFGGTLISNILRLIVAQYCSTRTVFIIAMVLPAIGIIGGVIYKEKKINYNYKSSNVINNNLPNSINNKNQKSQFSSYSKSKNSFKNFLQILLTKKITIPLIVLLTLSSTPSYMDSAFYYLTEVKKFSPRSFGTLTILISFLMTLCTAIYNLLFNKCKKIKLLICSSLFVSFCFSSIFNIWIKFNWTSELIVFLSIGMYAAVKHVAIMPIMNLGSSVCPKGYEGSVYSMFSSTSLLGRTLGITFGSVLMKIFGIGVGSYKEFNRMIFASNLIGLVFPVLVVLGIDAKFYGDKGEEMRYEVVEVKVNNEN